MRKLLSAIALVAASAATPVMANGDSGYSYQTIGAGDWLVRLRAISVAPNDDHDLTGGVDASIDTAVVPELDFTYFFTDNIAAELILATAQHHIGSTAGDVGEVWLLPPTLTLQYHFQGLGDFKPYVGAGVNYTIFYNEDPGALGLDFEVDDAFAWALQAGVDYHVGDGVYLNADVKYIALEADIDIGSGAVTGDAGINPLVVGIGIGKKF